MNNITIVGRITKDATTNLRNVGGHPTAVTQFTVAADSGRWVKEENGMGHWSNTEFFTISLWRDQATALAPYLKKGRTISAAGSVGVRAWMGTQGELANKPQAQLVLRPTQVILEGGKPVEIEEDDVPFEYDEIG